MKKVYRALTAETVEKMFIGDTDAREEGWFDTPASALRAFAPELTEPPRRGPGRPPKVYE